MPDLYGNLTPQAVLNGTLQTIVYADNYEDLRNKPSINSVTLIGNKTAAELGLATPADIPVESVNGYQGVVILDGDDIEYSAGVSVNDQIDTVAAAIPTIPVTSVNSKTGVVILDGDDIEYEAGTSVNSKITDLEAEIGSGPVVSVNGQQGVVELDGTDINYSLTKTINQKIDEVAASIPVVNYPVTSVNTKTGDVVLDGTDIEYSEGVTINDQIGNVADDIPADASELPLGTDFSDPTSTAGAIKDLQDKTTVTSGSITASTGYTVVNSNVKKIGNLVTISFVIKATTAITSRQTIANIANGFRPTQNEWYTFSGSSIVNGTSNRIITGLITSGGDIMVGDGIEPAGQSVIEFRGSCTYYTA